MIRPMLSDLMTAWAPWLAAMPLEYQAGTQWAEELKAGWEPVHRASLPGHHRAGQGEFGRAQPGAAQVCDEPARAEG